LNILPGIEKALKGMQPLWDVLAEMLPQLGTAIGDFFATISEDGPALAIVLKDILKGIIWFIGFLADSINELVFKYITVRKATIATVNWIKMAWGVLVNWWQNTIVPSWDKSVGQVVAFFHHLGDSINKAKDQARASWQWLTNWWTGTIVPSWKKSVGQVQTFFSNLGRWFSETMPNFFKQGAAKFGSALDSMRDYAKKPIIAVVGFINKGLIGPWNWIVDKLGIGKPIGEFHPAGFRDGGPIPGRRGLTRKDNRLAKVQSGEFVMPVDKTRAYLPVLEAMRRGNLPGFADGGIVGLVTNPVGTIGNMVGGPFRDLSNAVGNSPAGQIMKGVANKGKEGLIAKGKALITMLLGGESLSGVGSAIGNIFSGGVGYGLLQPAILGAVLQAKKLFGAPLISGFRAGSRTLSGNLSYHASGRAGDFPAIRALALFFRAVYGSKIKELISPWNDINMWNGRPHAYSGDVFAQHAGTGRFRGNAHVHLALADGGLVGGNDYSTLTGLRSDSHWDRVNENGPRTAIENVNVSYAPNVPTEEALFRTMQKLELLYG
jgi:hypothetical protein